MHVTSRATVKAELEALVAQATAEGVEKLRPERELAERLAVSRATVRRALDELEKRGLIFRVTGRMGGAFVTAVVQSAPIPPALFQTHSRKVRRDLNTIKGIPQMLQEQGFSEHTKVISETVEEVHDGIAEALELPLGSSAVSLLRLRFADDAPLSLERMFLDPKRFPDLLDHSPIDSMYSLLEEEYCVTIATCDETIEVVAADRQVASLLQLRPWTPVLAVRRITKTSDGCPIEASIDMFRPDTTRLFVSAALGSK